MVSSMAGGEPILLERSNELAHVRAMLSRAREAKGGLLVIEGPAGIGKTRLLEEAGRLGRAEGVTVLSACASELEREFGFGQVRQLLEEVVARAAPERRANLLDGAAALAAPALGLEADAEPDGEARYAVVHGLYWLVANMAAENPLVLAVDDLQWADESSLRFVAYLARRLGGLPVALLVALRPALPGEERGAVEATVAGAAATTIRLGPLSEGAVAALARERLAAEPDPAFVAACYRATRGNALLIEDLLAETAESGIDPDAAAASRVEDIGVERVARRVGRRIASLPAGAAALADAVAVLGDGCILDAAGALAGLDAPMARAAAAALAGADVLSDTTALRFRHPLVRAAVADRLPAVQAAAAHARAARVLAERGVPAAALAPHLAVASPVGDPWVVATLREAARNARVQGAPELAAAQLRRALAEPPRPSERPAVLRELGLAEHAAGLPAALGRLREARSAIEHPIERAAAALELVGALQERLRWRDAAEVARDALDDLGGADRELELRLKALLADCVRMDATIPGDESERLRQLAETLRGETPAERWVLATAASMAPADSAAHHAHVADLLERALADGGIAAGFPETGVISNRIRAGKLDAAERTVTRVIAEARGRGLVHRYSVMMFMRGWIELERGALAEAEADLASALELAVDVAGPTQATAAVFALVLAEQGRLDDAEQAIAQHELAGELPEHQVMNVALHFRSRIRLAQGRPDNALADALEVGRRYQRLGIRRVVPPWRSMAATLLAARGEAQRARQLAEEELELAERWGTPLARGLALRGIGLVTASTALLSAAVEILAESPSRLELARARIDLGAALRRAGRRTDSRAPLRLGMDAAHACGARPLAERARTELLATGARPRRLALWGTEALTPSERRVVELAASGRSNRRIAQELFVTTATVETHLRHAFSKLGVRSRVELRSALDRSG
jgi:DNA-binding CsgD family transcriptional regulator/tetratricopeptide (TPR) repeat protein